MDLDRIEQVEFKPLSKENIDILIVVSGYEDRCTFLAEQIKSDPFDKIVFAFLEKQSEGFRPRNDKRFRELDFEFVKATGEHGSEIQTKLEDLIEDINKDSIRILVDYSCMTKEWYAAIINYFVNWDLNVKEIELFFAYTPSSFEKPKRKGLLKKLVRRPAEAILDAKNKPVSLILGLGYDQDQAFELVNRIRPAATYAFYSDPSFDSRFVAEVEKRNREILTHIDPAHVYKYPMNDMREINLSLKKLCMDLRLDSQVILAPLGPKPFALACMLLSARYPDIWVWRVHTGQSDLYYEWKPYGDPIVCKAVFRNDMDEQW